MSGTTDKDETDKDNGCRRHPFRARSSWQPPDTDNVALKAFFEDTRRCLIRLKPKRSVHLNISRKERQTLIDLCNREDIIVKRANKGSLTVVEDRQTYSQMLGARPEH